MSWEEVGEGQKEREREKERERILKTGSRPSLEPDTWLCLTILRSQPEPKSRSFA